jgi:hypothetical protein
MCSSAYGLSPASGRGSHGHVEQLSFKVDNLFNVRDLVCIVSEGGTSIVRLFRVHVASPDVILPLLGLMISQALVNEGSKVCGYIFDCAMSGSVQTDVRPL